MLVVEDERLVALDICRSLERSGYRVIGPVASGEEAIRLAEDEHPDLILMDIMLQGDTDGVQAAAQISDSSDIPIIFLTAHADKATVDRAKLATPYAYVVKPFQDSELYASVEMALCKHRAEQASLSPSQEQAHAANGSAHAGRVLEGDREEVLRSLEFFSDLSDSQLKLLAHAASERTLAQGETLDRGAERGAAFIVRSGRVAMIEIGSDRKELAVELIGPGDLFGLIAAVQQFPTALVPRADRESELLLIPKKTFLLALEANSSLALRFTRYISERLRMSQVLSRAIAYDNVTNRVASVLDALAPRFGTRRDSSSAYVLDLTRQEIASLTGTTIETVVRVLKGMERQGIVALGRRRRIEVRSRERLAEMINNNGRDKLTDVNQSLGKSAQG